MSEQEPEIDSSINRRSVLKMTGAVAVGGVAVTGTASAHELASVRFCGCTTVCFTGADRDDDFEVKFAEETNGGFSCYTRQYDDVGSGECVDATGGDKVIAVRAVDDSQWVCNPNTCAEKALQDCTVDCVNCSGEGGPPGQSGPGDFDCSTSANGLTIGTNRCSENHL